MNGDYIFEDKDELTTWLDRFEKKYLIYKSGVNHQSVYGGIKHLKIEKIQKILNAIGYEMEIMVRKVR